jgi:glycosyltransferase involved in cell wall biosynthesis
MPAEPTGGGPFWSVMIPVYNSSKYLARTLESVLDQDPGPARMQIEVVDGHSTIDLPELQQIAGDRISVFRHAQPLSMAANWNSCIERARGEWVHILHSDDFVLPGFYSRLEDSLKSRSDVGAAFTRWTTVDEAGCTLEPAAPQLETGGILTDGLDRLAAAQVIQFPAMVVRKSAYEEVGGFRSDLTYALDWEMWVRLAARYPIWYEPELLACYRVHTESETMRLRRMGEDLADQAKAIAIFEAYLPPASKARSKLALRLLEIAKDQFVLRQPWDAVRRIVAALRLSHSHQVIASAVRLFGWTLAGAIRVILRRAGLFRSRPNQQGS